MLDRDPDQCSGALDGIAVAIDPPGDLLRIGFRAVRYGFGNHAVDDDHPAVRGAQAIQQPRRCQTDEWPGIGHHDGIALVERHHRAMSQVVPSLESLSTILSSASRSRMVSASLK